MQLLIRQNNHKALRSKKIQKSGLRGVRRWLVCFLLVLPLAFSFTGQKLKAQEYSLDDILAPYTSSAKAPYINQKAPSVSRLTSNLSSEASLTTQVLSLVNQARTDAGLNPVSLKADMASFVAVRAREISTNFNHIKADGSSPFSGYPGIYMGENIQQNYARSTQTELAHSIMDSFRSSPSHWANIMNPDWQYMNLGVYQAPAFTSGPYVGYSSVYICQWFSN